MLDLANECERSGQPFACGRAHGIRETYDEFWSELQDSDLQSEIARLRDLATNWYTADGVVKLTEQEVIERRKAAAAEIADLRDQVKALTSKLDDRNNALNLACGMVWLVDRVKAFPNSLRERGDAMQFDATMRALKADEYVSAEIKKITERGSPPWPLKENT
jgi:hypothetical protein